MSFSKQIQISTREASHSLSKEIKVIIFSEQDLPEIVSLVDYLYCGSMPP
jgi:hypothetical protein